MNWRMKISGLGLCCCLMATGVVVLAQEVDPNADQGVDQEALATPLEEIEAVQKQAKKLGAKSNLPMAWRQLDAHLGYAEENGATDAQWKKIRFEADFLWQQADFLNEVRQKKNGYEILLGRFDQALLEIASLNGITLDPLKTGSIQAQALLENLSTKNLQRQVTIDSLMVANRHLNETVGGQMVAQDSLITALNVEVRSLRQRLWETELRAGVAEADRSAAESVLTRKQTREASLATLNSSLSPDEGEILMIGDSRVIMRLHGISFAVGSSQLQSGQDTLLAKIAGALELFPGAAAQVVGHTDDTGSRKANLRLSRRRAETVARTLERMQGLPENTITTEGYGPDRPVALNDTAEGRARNRRIDLIIDLPK